VIVDLVRDAVASFFGAISHGRPWLRWLVVALYVLVLAGCGSSPDGSTQTSAAVVGGVSIPSVERALVTRGGSPRPTFASCRPATSAERRRAPFGNTRRPLFSCLLVVAGENARYDVQVLANGCYVAERHRRGRVVQGCGADRG
jgi:hypothetical protein